MAFGAAVLALLLSQAVLRSQADTGSSGKAWAYADVSETGINQACMGWHFVEWPRCCWSARTQPIDTSFVSPAMHCLRYL